MNNNKLFVLFFLLILFIPLIAAFLQIPFLTPMGFRHLVNVIFYSRDLCEPIIVDKFSFDQKSFTKTYELKPKYLDYYEVNLFSKKENIPIKFNFTGKLETTVFYKNKIVFKDISDSEIAGYLSRKDPSNYVKRIAFARFALPYKNNVYLKVTVLEPVQGLESFKSSVRLSVSVTGTGAP